MQGRSFFSAKIATTDNIPQESAYPSGAFFGILKA